jgi:hypothetical protein
LTDRSRAITNDTPAESSIDGTPAEHE